MSDVNTFCLLTPKPDLILRQRKLKVIGLFHDTSTTHGFGLRANINIQSLLNTMKHPEDQHKQKLGVVESLQSV